MASLVHRHARSFLARYRDSKDVDPVGVSEPDREVAARYVKQSRIDPATIHPSLDAMLDWARPQAVVAACARRKIPVMLEKPLAVSVEHARSIERSAAQGGIPVLVNYETTWYPAVHAAHVLAMGEKSLGEIRKVVVHARHRGPSLDYSDWAKQRGLRPRLTC